MGAGSNLAALGLLLSGLAGQLEFWFVEYHFRGPKERSLLKQIGDAITEPEFVIF